MRLTLVEGDITEQRVDAVVNAANSSLLGGGGVDGAIHRRGGPEILAACRALRASRYGGGLRTGQAVATTAGRLPARWVVHTVGPVWSPDEDRSPLLRSCYAESLRVADELGAQSIAFPLISAGVYGWPFDDAVRQALTVLAAAAASTVTAAYLVLHGPAAHAAAQRVAAGT
jgi:O-acetyl-ADP-ribose deacetylase (regulator of RNase III)